jgi:hypothetical protein
MTALQALSFVKKSGIALESARGPVPSLAEAIAGEPIRGSWWGHRKAHQIFLCSRAVRESKDVLVCRLVKNKVTYVHRRLWPALVRLSKQFPLDRLAAIRETHTSTGRHKVVIIAFPEWVPARVTREAARLTASQATRIIEGAEKAALSRAKKL